MTQRFFGKFLGIVVDNNDPKGLSRVKVRVPEVFDGETTGWAQPCELSGPGIGIAAVPAVNSLVFVEWPAGDTSRMPIWSGGPRSDGDGVPGAGPDAIRLVTGAGNKITVDDTSGSEAIAVEAASGAKVTLDSNGMVLEFGSQKVALTQSSVSINDGALEVM
jgi:Type VI secretion system/phage-baseplate injector OB domain